MTRLLAGRFRSYHLKPLTQVYAHELVFRLGEQHNIPVTIELAEAIWQLTGGYPYSIEALMTSLSPAVSRLPALDALEEVLIYEVSTPEGNLWKHYRREFVQYTDLLNGTQLTKKVLFWTTKYPGQQIDAEQIAQELNVKLEEVNAALLKLLQIDVVYRIGLTLFEGPNDPMLRRYIEYTHRREVEKLAPNEAVKDWRHEYNRLRGDMNNLIGHIGEGYLYAVMSAFDGRTVDGSRYFNLAGSVTLPHFYKIERRTGVIHAGHVIALDLVGEWAFPKGAGIGVWLVQVKNTQTPVDRGEAQAFLNQAEQMAQSKSYLAVTRWFFSKQGYTANAAVLLQSAGVLTSDLASFNQLAQLMGVMGLPE